MSEDMRTGIVTLNKKTLNATLVDLPTIVESYKMTDKVNLYKTADICQMLLCKEQSKDVKVEEEDDNKNGSTNATKKKYLYPHGITAPLKNCRKFRFRKTLRNKNDIQETADIEKEVLLLLRMDNEAVRLEIKIIL